MRGADLLWLDTAGKPVYDLTIDDFPPDRLAEIVRWRNDPAVNKYLRPGIRTLAEVREWYTQYFSQAENKLFAVYCDQTLIGYSTLEHIDATHRNCEIGLVIGDTRCWNKGLGALVVQRLITRAFTVYHLHRVYAVIQDGNIASMRCFAKAGFQHEGRFREARSVNGGWLDLHYYAILEQDWQP
jgi:RimJ/RimL family protein N-acetyltransferase